MSLDPSHSHRALGTSPSFARWKLHIGIQKISHAFSLCVHDSLGPFLTTMMVVMAIVIVIVMMMVMVIVMVMVMVMG